MTHNPRDIQAKLVAYLSINVGRLLTLKTLVDETGYTEVQIRAAMRRVIALHKWPVEIVSPASVWRAHADFDEVPSRPSPLSLPVGGEGLPMSADTVRPRWRIPTMTPARTPTPTPTSNAVNARLYEQIGTLDDGRALLRGDDGKTYVALVTAI